MTVGNIMCLVVETSIARFGVVLAQGKMCGLCSLSLSAGDVIYSQFGVCLGPGY